MRLTLILSLASIGLAASGCATAQHKVKVLRIDSATPSVVTYPTELRGAYMRSDGSALRFCAEPAPDVALSTIENITANLQGALPNGMTVDAAFSRQFQATVVELAGRTQLVLLAREMLYRAGEIYLNNSSERSEEFAIRMYSQVVELVGVLGAAEKTRAEAAKTEAEAEAERVKAAIAAQKSF